MKKLENLVVLIGKIDLFKLTKTFYKNLIDLVGFIIGSTSDQGADIVIRALPLVSPAPNAISMYYVSQSELGFNFWQAVLFAACIEFILFGLFEVSLMLYDGFQVNAKKHKYPLWISIAISFIAMILIMVFVFKTEKQHQIMAALPLFSASGAIALALKRWYVRNANLVLETLEGLKETVANLRSELFEQNQKANQVELELRTRLDQLNGVLIEKELQAKQMAVELEGYLRQIDYLERQPKQTGYGSQIGVLEPVLEPVSGKQNQLSAEQRRVAVLKAVAQTSKKSDLNFSELARTFGTSDTTIKKDLAWLIENELWENHGDWKPTPKAMGLLGG